MHEDPEVAQLLRHLMRGGDEPRDHAELDVDDERAPDRQPADQVVNPVGEQDQIPDRLVPRHRLVAVMPVVRIQGLRGVGGWGAKL